MGVFLEAIKLNHYGAAATSDALNILPNEATAVNVPEWVRGVSTKPEDSPAAYSIAEAKGDTLTIQARFSTNEQNDRAHRARQRRFEDGFRVGH